MWLNGSYAKAKLGQVIMLNGWKFQKGTESSWFWLFCSSWWFSLDHWVFKTIPRITLKTKILVLNHQPKNRHLDCPCMKARNCVETNGNSKAWVPLKYLTKFQVFEQKPTKVLQHSWITKNSCKLRAAVVYFQSMKSSHTFYFFQFFHHNLSSSFLSTSRATSWFLSFFSSYCLLALRWLLFILFLLWFHRSRLSV